MVDESTDVENKVILLVYVRYINQDDLREDLLCALTLTRKSTGEKILKALGKCMSGKLSWDSCVRVGTDGAVATTLSGFITRVKQVALNCGSIHCCIHCEVLACMRLSLEPNQVMSDVIQILNLVKTRELNTRLSERFCDSSVTDWMLKTHWACH